MMPLLGQQLKGDHKTNLSLSLPAAHPRYPRPSLTQLALCRTGLLVQSIDFETKLTRAAQGLVETTKVLADQGLAEMLRNADEMQLSVFRDWTKFQILIQQGKTPEGIKWVFMAAYLICKQVNAFELRYDGIKLSLNLRYDGSHQGYLNAGHLSCRSLQGVTCKCMLAQKALLDLMLRHMDSEFDDWPDHVKKAIREVSQGHNALRETLCRK